MILFLYRLFFNHFEVVLEDRMDAFECTQDQANIKYYAKDFPDKDDELLFEKCSTRFPIKQEEKEMTELFNNSILDIETKANCTHCGHFNHNHIRFKRGYVMTKKEGEWICIVPKCSLIAECFYKLKNLFF